MSKALVTTNPKGIFNRRSKGAVIGPVEVEVERGRIAFFARVLGEQDPVHTDRLAAQARGWPDLVAPPSFFMVLEAAANEELQRSGQPTAAEVVGCDYRRLLHGDETYEYLGHVFAGDRVSVTTTVVDFFDKKGGAMEFVTLSSEVIHPDRGVLIRTTRNLLHRLG